ncbi:cytochrome P450 [Whalleya microplaca]|nr:cytochrome P450 [Whalleya microplaca]
MASLDVLFTAAAYAAYFIVPWFLLLGCFRLLFHPLRSYPGPLFAKLTDAYGGYFAIRKCLHLATYQNFQIYGPVVRQAPNRLVFNTVTALQDIYLNPRVAKGHAYKRSQLRAKYPSIINVIDKDQHRRKRKFIGQALTERSMRAFEPTMISQIDVFLQLLLASSQNGSYVDMTDRCQRLGVDVVGLLAFGYPFKTQNEDNYGFLISVIDAMSWRISTYMQFSPVSRFENLFSVLGARHVIKFGNTVQTMIRTRMAQDKDAHHDLYSIMADYIGKGQEGLYRGELWPEAILFIMAGAQSSFTSQYCHPVIFNFIWGPLDSLKSHYSPQYLCIIRTKNPVTGGTTTASAMSALFFYLSRNPTCYATLADEIRSTFSTGSEIRSGSQLNSCKYLRACIDEALRMSPPSLTSLWREQDAGDDSGEPFVVDGHVIPRGTQVAVSLYSLLHNEEYFPDPFTFNPERWLESPEASAGDSSGENQDARATMRKAFVPFLIGDRSCAGKSMAYMEASLTIARTLWFFDFEVAPGKAGEVGGGNAGRTDGRGRPDEFQLDDIFVAAHRGPNLVFHPRGDYWKVLLYNKYTTKQ